MQSMERRDGGAWRVKYKRWLQECRSDGSGETWDSGALDQEGDAMERMRNDTPSTLTQGYPRHRIANQREEMSNGADTFQM
jgi:hypothetical protein